MKYLPLIFAAIFIIAFGCKSKEKSTRSSDKKDTVNKEIPDWLESTLKENFYESAASYLFQGDTVYLLTPPCCDRYTELYDQQGRIICHPGGGITGRGDGKCPDFRNDASQIKLIPVDSSESDE